MRTYTAFHLQSTDVDGIQEACHAWLAATHHRRKVSVDTGRFPSSAFINILDDKPPTILVLGQTYPDWVTIHYNSFFEMEVPAARLSGQFGCLGVVVLAQTVSDYYFISVYRNGENIRALEFSGNAGGLVQKGTPLPFEQAPLGENISEPDEEPFYFFGSKEAAAYCNDLGFSIFGDDYESQWAILKAKRKLFGLL